MIRSSAGILIRRDRHRLVTLVVTPVVTMLVTFVVTYLPGAHAFPKMFPR
jgi:hypothetical protein